MEIVQPDYLPWVHEISQGHVSYFALPLRSPLSPTLMAFPYNNRHGEEHLPSHYPIDISIQIAYGISQI
jgi:hypothetical protein